MGEAGDMQHLKDIRNRLKDAAAREELETCSI